MIGGRRYLPGDQAAVYTYNEQTGKHDMSLHPADEVYTDNAELLKAINSPKGFGGINWNFVGYVMAEQVSQLPTFLVESLDAVWELLSGFVSADTLERLESSLDSTKAAPSPLFGPEEWNDGIFSEGSLDLASNTKLLLAIGFASYMVSKVPGLTVAISSVVMSALARAKVNGRHEELIDVLSSIEDAVELIGVHPGKDHVFSTFDDNIDSKAIRALLDGLMRDRKGPLNSLTKEYPDWALPSDN